MLEFLNKYRRDYFASQNGEEGLLLEIVKRLGLEAGHACEIGANNGLYCSNTALLIRDHGWSGTMVETDFGLWQQCRDAWAQRPDVKTICSHADVHNINAFVTDKTDLVSLDTDGSDFDLWAAIKAQPKVVIIEIDSSLPPGVLQRDDGFLGTYSNTVALGLMKGYFLVAHTGNLIFVRNDYRELFPEIEGDPLVDSDLYFNRGWIKAA